LGEVVVLRGRIAKRVREEADRLGVSVDEYVVELLSQGLDPRSKALNTLRLLKICS